MSDIGPGVFLQQVTPSVSGLFTVGAIYQVERFGTEALFCVDCRLDGPGVKFYGKPGDDWCWCGMRPWPPPADEALRNEEAPQDADPVSVPA